MKWLAVFSLVVIVTVFCLTAAAAVEQVHRSSVVKAQATVVAVDQENRIVTLKGPEGNTFNIAAGQEVRNLSQLKAGDQVNVTYYESLLVRMAKPGQKSASSVNRSVERAAPGQRPGGSAAEEINTTATVVAINKAGSEVTLKGPQGNVVTVKAADPKNIEKLKVGDQIDITYTQAAAISVEKAAG